MRIAVIGAGVAGLATATLLARSGHAVVLIERQAAMPEGRGGLLLQPCGLAVLSRLGLLDEALERGARISQLVRQHVSGEVTARLRYESFRSGAHGLGIARGMLTAMQARAAAASGVEIALGCVVSSVREGRSAAVLETTTANDLGEFAAVVVASGMRTPLRSCLDLRHQVAECRWGALSVTGPRAATVEGDVVRQRFRRGPDVIGLLPCGRDASGREFMTWFQNMAVAQYDAPDRMSFAQWRDQALLISPESRELLMPVTGFEAVQYSRYATVSMPKWSTRRCVVIGDAAHALDPLLGMGANMALVDAATLADGLSVATDQTLEGALRAFQASREPQISRYQRAGAMLSSLMLTDHPLVSAWPDMALRAALWAPAGRQRIMAAIFGE